MHGGSMRMPGAFHLGTQHRKTIGVAECKRHACSEEHFRMVRLQPSGLIREQSIRRGVAFVEAVAGETRHQVEDFRRLLRVDATLDGALGEDVALRFHLRGDLLAHRAAQQIRAPSE